MKVGFKEKRLFQSLGLIAVFRYGWKCFHPDRLYVLAIPGELLLVSSGLL